MPVAFLRTTIAGAVLALGSLFALGTTGAAAQAPPNPPARFAGAVTVNGQPAAAGTSLEARVGTASCGSTTTFVQNGEARYVVDVAGADSAHAGCGTDNAVVTFFVGGVQAAQSGPWLNYQLSQLNLTVGAASTPTASATATATLTTTPVAPATGSGQAGSGDQAAAWLLLPALAAGALLLGGFAFRKGAKPTR